MSERISILLVDDHTLVRESIRQRLAAEPDMCVVASVSTADEALAQAAILRPQLVVMDVDMPGMNCFDAARAILRALPAARIAFLSGFCDDRYIGESLATPARAYILKSEPPEAVIAALRAVAAGGSYYSPEIQSRLVVNEHGVRLATHRSPAELLTPRQLQVLRLLAEGCSKKEVAARMHISVNTVNRHTSGLMNKLGIHDRVELTRLAIREGLSRV